MWTRVQQFHLKINSHMFTRTPKIDLLYNLTKGQIRNNFIHRVDFSLQNQPYLIWDNTYPYDLPHEIIHQVFWFKGNNYSMNAAWEICQKHYPTINSENIIVFSNSPHLKSIPEIQHYHIFINTNPSFTMNEHTNQLFDTMTIKRN